MHKILRPKERLFHQRFDIQGIKQRRQVTVGVMFNSEFGFIWQLRPAKDMLVYIIICLLQSSSKSVTKEQKTDVV